LLKFIRAASLDQWFKPRISKTVAEQDKHKALSTLLPDQYLSGDAIRLSLNALQYEPPTGLYVFETLLSQITGADRTNRLWNALWRRSREASTARLRSIILPINAQNYHWYIAILHVGLTQCRMEICTDANTRNFAAEQTLTEIGIRYLSQWKPPEPPTRPADKDETKVVSPRRQRGGPTVTPVRKPKPGPPNHAPQGYRVMDVPRDGHCLLLACIEAMAHNRLSLPPAWLSAPRKDQHKMMRTALLRTCKNEFYTESKYRILHEGLLAESDLNNGQTLLFDMCDRLRRGQYRQASEMALIACKYDLEIIVFENGTQKWIQKSTGTYQQRHIIALRWCRESIHYDWLQRINSDEPKRANHPPVPLTLGLHPTDADILSPPPSQESNRARQPKNKFSHCLNSGNGVEMDSPAPSAKCNRGLRRPGFLEFGPNFRDADNIPPPNTKRDVRI